MQESGFVKEGMMEEKLMSVSKKTKQVREVPDRWLWTEPSIWTERMLFALERGVKGDKWFSLIDKVYRLSTLEEAFKAVKRNKGAAGVDNESIERFRRHKDEKLLKLSELLITDRYQPQAVKRVWIDKPGKKNEQRPLGIPTVRDRVVQTALRMVIEPIFEKDFAEHSYGFRPKSGCKDALRQVWKLYTSGYKYVLDADLKSYFDTIDHDILMAMIAEKIADSRVLSLISQYLNQEVMDTAKRWNPERGTPQGAVISPLLANIFLNPLDHKMAELGFQMVRYADDFVIMCQSQEEAEEALVMVKDWCEGMKLTLHPEKTRIVNSLVEEFVFLGYKFKGGRRYVSKKSQVRFRDSIRPYTKRTNGHSMDTIIKLINPKLRGWFEYYKHAYKTDAVTMDEWVRMRLRSILRKRAKRKGRGRGADHHRYPIVYFHGLGLFSMVEHRKLAAAKARSG
jgi:RNA-directed DNA polymerase